MTKSLEQLKLLAIFAAIVREGSFIRAAESLGLSRSKVSEALQKLEADLDLRLIERTTRKLNITEAGQAIFDECEHLLNHVDNAVRIGETFTTDVRGNLRITAPHDFGYFCLGPVIREYKARYPDINVSLMLRDQLVDFVDQRIDLAFRVMVNTEQALISRKLLNVQGAPLCLR